MTSETGIKGYDPMEKQEYVLVATDSQRTMEDDQGKILRKGYDMKKLILPQTKNQIIAYAGLNLHQAGVDYPEEIKRNLSRLHNSKNLSSENLEKIFEEINFQLKKVKGENTYILGIEEKGKINLKAYDKNGLSKNLLFTSAGEGQKFLDDFIGNRLKKTKMDEKGVIMPLSEAMILSMQGLNYAAKNDEYTGGNFNFGILTKDKRCTFTNFAKIDKSIGYRGVEDLYYKSEKEKIKLIKEINNEFRGNRLEDLIFT